MTPEAPEDFDFVNGREAWQAGWEARDNAAAERTNIRLDAIGYYLWDELVRMMFPNCFIAEDNEGQLLIYTDLTINEDNEVVPFIPSYWED